MKKIIRYLLVLVSLSLFFSGAVYYSFNVMLCGVLAFWVNNLIYSFENVKNRIFFMFFNFMIFVFLLSRPTISMVRGNVWWYFAENDVIFALNALMLTLIFLFLGQLIGERAINRREGIASSKLLSSSVSDDFIKGLRIISLMLYFLSIFCFIVTEFEKLVYMRGKAYEELYTSFKTSLPYVITTIGSMNKYFLCIFLASMPKKKLAFVPLVLYVVSEVPSLIIGLRNPIVLNAIFAFLYYFIRDALENQRKWLGIVERVAIIAFAPIAILLLGAYNYIRAGQKVVQGGAFELFVDFLYKQGVSFDVLCIGHNSIPKIKYTGFVNYTFGGFIDYFTHNNLAQILFGARSLGTGNNINMALYSNNFSHRMSYVSRGQEYLDGNGWGSSYLLETYADFGYVGIILFSVLLGLLFAYMMVIISRGNFCFSIVLIILTSIYFCPRDEALGWINFVIYMQFLLPVAVCFLFAKLCVKRYSCKDMIKNYQ